MKSCNNGRGTVATFNSWSTRANAGTKSGWDSCEDYTLSSAAITKKHIPKSLLGHIIFVKELSLTMLWASNISFFPFNIYFYCSNVVPIEPIVVLF